MPPKRKAAASVEQAEISASATNKRQRVAALSAKGQVNKKSTTTTCKKNIKGKKASAKVASKPAAAPSKKRKQEQEPTPALSSSSKRRKISVPTNLAPTQKLDVYVFGSGESGELGLGSVIRNKKKPTDVRRPRLNDLLDATKVGVVQMAVGGMHCVALTHDGKILTWGVNDNGALGRDTTWEAPTKDIDAGSDSDDSEDECDSDLNPLESTPTAIAENYFQRDHGGLVQVTATDSASFALTSKGVVYGWGTFSGSDGNIGFSKTNYKKETGGGGIQKTPTLISNLKNIISLAGGGNHVLALDNNGAVYAWGSGEQYQLGRPIMERYRTLALEPSLVRIPRAKGQGTIASVAAGQYHSFALSTSGHVYGWGLNNFAQTGIPTDGQATASLIVPKPKLVESLLPGSAAFLAVDTKAPDADDAVAALAAGNHHSLALTSSGRVLSFGRCDSAQAGMPLSLVPRTSLVFDDRGRARILSAPTRIASLDDVPAAFVAAGIDNGLCIATMGGAYSWGFGANYRTGLGTQEPMEVPTMIENSALVGKRLCWAGCGGQFSVLAGPAGEADVDEDL